MAYLKVNGVAVPMPSEMTWSKQDVSSEDAGRTQDTVMHKMKLSEKVKLVMKWNNVSPAIASQVMQAFSPEYMNVTYLDPMTNTYVTKYMYAGDFTVPVYSYQAPSGTVYQSVALDVIEV